MITEILTTAAFATMSFQALSGNPKQVSIQKNLISQAIRMTFPDPSAFIEETNNTELTFETDIAHLRLELKCLLCQREPDDQSIVLESVRFSSERTGSSSYLISFETAHTFNTETQSSTAKNLKWEIAVEAKPLLFGIFANKITEKDEIAVNKKFSIFPCLAALKCQHQLSYVTSEKATEELSQFVGKNAKRTIVEGKQVSYLDFELPTIIQRGDTVTVTLNNKNGLILRTLATALKSGKSKDMIPVTLIKKSNTLSSGNIRGETITARVTSTGEVVYEN